MDGETFRELVERHYRGCYALGYRLTRDVSTAEDLAQEAFLRLHQRRDRLGPDTRYGAYLRRILVNLVIDRARAERRRREVVLENEPEVAPVESDGLAEALRRELLEIPRREAEVFTLRVVEDRSTRETAEALGISEGAVRRYLFDAVRRLRGGLKEYEP
jgi:RNA polymerase sigma factor (sigma-70 family)